MDQKRGIYSIIFIFLVLVFMAVSSYSANIAKDGLDDEWKRAHGLAVDRNVAGDDPDSDGLTNIEEHGVKTDPQSADSDGDGTLDGDDPEPLNPKVPFRFQWINIGISASVIVIAFILIFYLFTLDYSKILGKSNAAAKKVTVPQTQAAIPQPVTMPFRKPVQSYMPPQGPMDPNQRFRMREQIFSKFDAEKPAARADEPAKALPLKEKPKSSVSKDEDVLQKLSRIAKSTPRKSNRKV